MAVIGLTLISIAVPPIPGGGLASYSVLFALLGIPAEGLVIFPALTNNLLRKHGDLIKMCRLFGMKQAAHGL